MSAKSDRILYGLIIAAVFILPLVLFGSGFFRSATERVLPGVEVLGVQLGGLTKAEGVTRLGEVEKTLRASRVVLRYQDRTWNLLLNEVGFNLNEEAVMDAALQAGRSGSLYKRWQEKKQFQKTGLALSPVFEYDREKLSSQVGELADEIIVEPVDATFRVNSNDTVSIVPAKDGIGVDLDRLEKDINNFLGAGLKQEVNLTLIPVAPSRSTDFVESMKVDGLLSRYTTAFDPSKTSRSYNVSVAAQAFDELLIMPGHEVSFNKVVGPRSTEAGYKNAPVIVNNEFVDGPGGGVCQVSTTLYNCILLANLDIIERSSHSLPVSYVPIGRDATVVYDAIDMKFRNNTDSYLYIKSYVSGGQLTIKIYGNTKFKRDVTVNSWIIREIEPQVIYETDASLPKGEEVVKQEGSKGFIAAAERVVRLKGVVEKRERLPSSDYNPVNKIIAVGTAVQSVPQIAPSTPSPSGPPKGGQDAVPINNNGGSNINSTANPAIPTSATGRGITAGGPASTSTVNTPGTTGI
ncbi:Vancomycin B-type resistance protein VanW [Pelotomaculum sp. FP]|uniref:VanW family protein n=1 Tax=Pelotomaculum sp. FP TaxID=261474 RepID=UPI0010665EF1|nr:VanW family protein [Pelotomaculum sp. FP]TEB17629.1 Vancomycin B-type resistance protein VanW [Pelotomaculum sp. FP]